MTKCGWDNNGLEGLPFKLLIISIVLALSVPIVVANWMNYDRQQTITQLEVELNYIEAQIEQLYDDGLGFGNSRVLDVNIRDGTFTKIDYVEIGGFDLASFESKCMRWKLKGEDEQLHILSRGMPARSEDGGAFKLKHGLNNLYMEIKKENGVVFVEIGFV